MKIPTDKNILEAIFKRYGEEFQLYENNKESRQTKVFVPIRCADIAEDLKTDKDIIFGRLYYHFERKFGYENDDGRVVHFFALQLGCEKHCVNFPLMTAVLAGLQEQQKKFLWPVYVSLLSLGLSIASLFASII